MSERRRPDHDALEDAHGAHVEEVASSRYARDAGVTYRAATAGPTHGLRLVAVLAIALIGVGVAAGFLPRSTAVGPSGSENAPSPAVAEGPPRTAPPLIPNPADPPLGELERCPGGTRTADIIDTSLPGNTTPHRAPGIGGSPTDVFRTGRIAVAIPGPANRAQIELVDPATSEACLLVELDNAVVRSMRWAPGMQALAIAASSDAANRQGIYIWSTAGSITRAATFDGPASLSFSPRESHLAIGGANLWLLASDGSPPVRLHCETPNSTDQCPEFPELLWSPDGQMIATSLGLAGHFVQPFGIASLEEGIFRPLRSGAAFPFDQGVKPLGWLDATGALIVYHPVPPHLVWIELGDPIRIGRQVDLPSELWFADFWLEDRAVVSPDGTRLDAIDLATGKATTGIVTIDELELGQIEPGTWTADGQYYIFRMSQTTNDRDGIWVVRPDGTGLRRLGGPDLIFARVYDLPIGAEAAELLYGG